MHSFLKPITYFYHPLIIATCALITGILFFTWYNNVLILFFCLVTGVALFYYYFHTLPLSLIALIITFFIIGYGRTYFYCTAYDSFLHSIAHKRITLRGSIIDIDPIDHAYLDSCITFSINSIQDENTAWKTINKTMQIYTKKTNNLTVGDSVIIKKLQCTFPSKESFKFYLMKEGIDATCFTPFLMYKILKKSPYSIDRLLHTYKTQLINSACLKLSPYTNALFSSLFLGYKKKCKQELAQINEQFKQWGILHYLARSGLHLVIFIFIWQTVLRIIPFSLFIKNSIMLLLGIFYFVLTWPSISFIRAFIIFLLYKLCSYANIQSSLLHLLTLCCFLILLYNPLQLFALDFQLSFILTFALAWFGLAYPYHKNN